MRYRLIIFDFDGTLADSFPVFVGIVNDLADKHGYRPVTPGEIEALRGASAGEIVARVGLPRWRLPLIAADMKARMAAERDRIRLFPGVGDVLTQLSDGGATLAVVSSNAGDTVRRVLGPQLAARIAHYECGAALFGKAARFARVLRRAGIPPTQALAVGDEIRDGEAARSAGIDFGAVTWGYATPAALAAHGPTHLFATVADIAGIITEIA